jgi:transposase
MSDASPEQLQRELQRVQVENRALRTENELLRQKLDVMARRLFGKKSEALSPDQLQLLFQELLCPGPAVGKPSGPEIFEAPSPRPQEAPPAAASPRRKRGPRVPEHLPVIEETIVPEPVKACPEAWRRIGEEVTERLDFEPARFFCRRTIRPKYVRKGDHDTGPVIAALPPCILERSIATPALVAQILVSKYCDHLPLYRQEQIFASRHGVELSRQTMTQWVGIAADWLRLIYEAIAAEVLGGEYVQVDETPIRYLEPGAGKARQGYFFACHRPGAGVLFHWQTSRAAASLKEIIPAGFSGTIQCDGFAGYDAFQRTRGQKVLLAGCMAHVRRKFFEALEHAPKEAALVLDLIQSLYRIEADLREARAGPEVRALRREEESRPLLERLGRMLLEWKAEGRFLAQSLMGKAIAYALGEWESLLVYLSNGLIEIDNNLVENVIRPTAVGKKNWLFIGEAEAGQRSAVIFTIVAACRQHGIDPFEYLREVLGRLPAATTSDIASLTPAAWARSRSPEELRPAA